MIGMKKLVAAAVCLGVAIGSTPVVRASIPAGYPNQCYFNCQGCGGDCLGKDYICCNQSGAS